MWSEDDAMRVLVLGGTRFFGRATVERLIEHGHRVTVLSRGVTPLPFSPDAVRHLRCDRNERGAAAELLSGEPPFDVVFDNSAMTESAVREVLEGIRPPVRYILTSSGAVYHRPHETPMERLPGVAERPEEYDPFDFLRPLREDRVPLDSKWLEREIAAEEPGYRRGKLEAERVLIEMTRGNRTSPVILRPPQIEGPRDPTGRTEFFARRVRDGRGVILPADGAGGVFQKVFSEDLAELVVDAVECPEQIEGAYNVAREEIFTMERYLGGLALILGVDAPPIHYLSRAQIRDSLGANYRVPVPSPKVADVSRAKTQLGFEPKEYSYRMTSTLRWILDRAAAPGYSELRERELKILARL
ncbi:MAG: NAD-dependent epimerase/dehydratase family protein [Bacillota bacterium]